MLTRDKNGINVSVQMYKYFNSDTNTNPREIRGKSFNARIQKLAGGWFYLRKF